VNVARYAQCRAEPAQLAASLVVLENDSLGYDGSPWPESGR
jgi:hypothetical protein